MDFTKIINYLFELIIDLENKSMLMYSLVTRDLIIYIMQHIKMTVGVMVIKSIRHMYTHYPIGLVDLQKKISL